MKKRFAVGLFLVIWFTMVTACAKPAEESGSPAEESGEVPTDTKPMTDDAMPADNRYHAETDYQYSWNWQGGETYFQRIPEGIAYWGLERLYMIDEADMQPQPCCLRPDCGHRWDDLTCTAGMLWSTQGIGYANGQLYYTEEKPSNKGKGELYSMTPAGIDRKKQVDYPQSRFSSWILHRGYLYSYYLESSEADRKESETRRTLKLTQTSLADPSQTKTLWTAGKCEQWERGYMAAYGNYLIFSRGVGSIGHGTLFSLNLQTGELKEFSGWGGNQLLGFTMGENKVFVKAMTKEKISFASLSLDFEEQRDYPEWDIPMDAVEEISGISICSDSKYIYRQIFSTNQEAIQMEIMDWQGRALDTVDVSVFNGKGGCQIFCDPEEDGSVFITSGGRNWGFYYFQKSEIGSGAVQLQPLPQVCGGFEYVPPGEVDSSDW